MSSILETPLGSEKCLLLERHRIAVSIDLVGVHVRIRGADGALLSHLAASPARARAIARLLNQGADRLDPPAHATAKIEAVK